jgi:cytochrome o ubiquinol oxidase subunit IV
MAIIKSYTLGFTLSILLTLAAYFIVANHLLSGAMASLAIIGLALIQLWVQLIFFLHLGQESKPHWNLWMFLATFSLILIVIIGSLWIMQHLNYHMMPDDEIIKNEGIYK